MKITGAPRPFDHDQTSELRLVLDAAPVAIIVSDAGGRIVLANVESERTFGVPRGELLGRKIESLVPQRYRTPHVGLRDGYLAAPSLRRMGAGRELFAVRADGSEFPVEIGLAPVAASGIEYVMAVMIDISDRKRAEELRVLNAGIQQHSLELEALNKEMESFSYSVSHDLRAPVRAVKEYAAILERDYGGRLDVEGRQILGFVQREAERMGSLIEDLLKFSSLGRRPIEKHLVDMNALVREVAGAQRLLAPPGAELLVDTLPSAYGDPSLLRQVWTNLIANALKYSAKQDPSVVQIAGWLEDGHAVFRIEDNGVGFNMKYYDKLFGVFQRLHHADEFPGSGVGLAIVQNIVERHGGRVWAHSAPGKGAMFFFTLPAGAPD